MKSKIIIAACLLATPSFAQTVVSTGALVSVDANTTLFNGNDFINHGTVINNGVLVISGAWTNTGDYQAGTGEVNFDGPGTQIINHNAQSFAKLLISGGGEKLFQADISIQQELTLQDGVLTTDNGSKIFIDEQATITGGSAGSYVQGALYHTGTGLKFFPVGINTHYLPLTFLNVAGTTPTIGIEVIEPNPNSNHSSALQDVSANRYWLLTTSSGSFTGSQAQVPLLNESFSQATGNIVVAQAASGTDPFQSLGQSDFSGTILSGSVTSKDPVTGPWIAVAEENGNKSISVFNAVTPGNNDGKHDFLKIVNIEYYPNNEVSIVNRWGEKVWEISGYNNTDRVFNGEGNVGGVKTLGDGTFYYVIDPKNGDKRISGFFIIRR